MSGFITDAEIERFNKLLVHHVQMNLGAAASTAVSQMYGHMVNQAHGNESAADAIRRALHHLERAEDAES